MEARALNLREASRALSYVIGIVTRGLHSPSIQVWLGVNCLRGLEGPGRHGGGALPNVQFPRCPPQTPSMHAGARSLA